MHDTELTDEIEVGPDIGVESWRLAVPARAACYVLEDDAGAPVTMATVGDLRAALVRRLGPDPSPEPDDPAAPRRKIDYRQVVRRVRWRGVYSRFEGDWVYLQNVRERFPKGYRRMIRMWRAAWLGVDAGAAAPHFAAADAPLGPAATCFGPFATLKAARRHAQMLEDIFDMCRYPNVLAQSPRGVACAYKQMGRCPAPCDGSIAMAAYREQVASAIDFVSGDRRRWREQAVQTMKHAAAAREYERAGRLKAMLDAAKAADSPAARFVAPLDAFRFLVAQRGDRRGRARLFAVTPGVIEPLGQIGGTDRERAAGEMAERARPVFAAAIPAGGLDRAGAERIGLVAWHLLAGDRARGLYVRLGSAPDPATIIDCADRLAQQQAQRRGG